MTRNILLASLMSCFLAGAVLTSALAQAGGREHRTPVLVELFTSEGCSTCPPADAVLEELDRMQPVASARIIPLSEHVDYWDHDGWKDPFSSALFSRRQEAYDRRLGISGPYTPQMVVDGRITFNGSNGLEAESAIRNAAQRQKLVMAIEPAPANRSVDIEVKPARPGFPKVRSAVVYLAVAQDSSSSDVLRGENRGQRLHYISILRKLREVGTMNPGSGFRKQVSVGTHPGQHLIAFVEEPAGGKVLGVAVYEGSK